VAVGSFGLQSDQSLVSVVGALCEIPTMLALVRIALYFKTHLTFKEDDKVSTSAAVRA
jgi:ACR3 family arsenite efflux pump ArsB